MAVISGSYDSANSYATLAPQSSPMPWCNSSRGGGCLCGAISHPMELGCWGVEGAATPQLAASKAGHVACLELACGAGNGLTVRAEEANGRITLCCPTRLPACMLACDNAGGGLCRLPGLSSLEISCFHVSNLQESWHTNYPGLRNWLPNRLDRIRQSR